MSKFQNARETVFSSFKQHKYASFFFSFFFYFFTLKWMVKASLHHDSLVLFFKCSSQEQECNAASLKKTKTISWHICYKYNAYALKICSIK